MAIGVFDSGVGGLTVHRELTRRFPGRDLVYLADQANAPIGSRSGEEIVEITRSGCERLFEAGASVVVLACNTASAVALRRLQQTWVGEAARRHGRPVNVLGIIVPTIEAATGLPWTYEAERLGDKVEAIDITGVFCTAATAISRVYEIEIDKRREDLAVFSEPCPGLAGLIELGAPTEELSVVVADHVDALRRRIGRHPDTAILGCTHYEIVADLFAAALPDTTTLIHQPSAVADALERYFDRHPEYALGDAGRRTFLTTGKTGPQSDRVSQFWGAPLSFEAA
ncbi:aspartate/glutamate racemase family protein [Brevundimonas sp. AJA228-03]|jgi:glutamate racemase|uniref:glutamate racemase n=1 Tax=Brevundimonas sp. AJA228-03 TaxID=2752515 RepID=UPI001AE0E0A8|nr:aspartate/glutamate racemase family protein [Brevundimonas sp. AJA228-03]QTN19662.1 aspartate/glutamate racemase family protein [Brevundimonas sp. AJA228-03]